jgi:hypothetical protein
MLAQGTGGVPRHACGPEEKEAMTYQRQPYDQLFSIFLAGICKNQVRMKIARVAWQAEPPT